MNIKTLEPQTLYPVKPFPQVRVNEVLWQRRLWREIDLSEKQNQHLYFPKEDEKKNCSLYDILFYYIEKGLITAYDTKDDAFTKELTTAEVINIIGDSLFLLLSRDFAPIELRLKSIASRLKRTPQLLEETKKSLKSPVKLWTKLAIESCIRFPEFLKTIKAVGKQRLKGKDYQILKKGCSETEQAISDFKDYLEDVLYPSATEKFALGPMKFRKLLRLRELGLSSEEILLIGQRLLASEKRRLKRVANKIKPGAGVNEIREDIKSRYPKDFNEVIRTVKKSIQKIN